MHLSAYYLATSNEGKARKLSGLPAYTVQADSLSNDS
jgi:hypothetical protein